MIGPLKQFVTRPMEITSVDGDSATVHFVNTDVVNWLLLEEDGEVTLIDGGYPGQADQVIESIERIGRHPGDIRGALLTHAHVDHLGGLVTLHERYGFPVYMDPVEVAHARREYLQQADPISLAPLARHRRVLAWLAKVTPLGVLSRKGIDDAQGFPGSGTGALDLPGTPVPVAAHGHTDGHSAFLVADGAALVSGDALVSDHETTAITGPQCLPGAFQHDATAARRTVEEFASLDADLLLAGHGPFYRGSVSQATQRALNVS